MKAIDYYNEKIPNFESMDFEQRRYWVEYECLESQKKHTKATLKALFRVKPAKDAVPCGSYTNDYKQEIDLYHFSQCVPMRALSTKGRSDAQKAATEKLKKMNFEKSPRGKAVKLCKDLISNNAVVIDTETTDLDGVAIQIAAVCCNTREVLYSSLIYTDEPISQGALDVHGISSDMLVDAPKPQQVYKELKEVCSGRAIVAFNCDFDYLVCKRTFNNDLGAGSWWCAMMEIAVPVLGATNRYGTISLSNATAYAGVKWVGSAHDAAGDALATVDLIRKIATIGE